MLTKFHRTFTRPNLEVEFPADPAEFTQYVTDTYVSTGKCVEHRTVSYSEDNLTKTCSSVWSDLAAFAAAARKDSEYIKNPEFLAQYCTENQIIIESWAD